MTIKELTKEIDAFAENWLPIPQPMAKELVAWAELHGWNLEDLGCQRLIFRQALLNACIHSFISSESYDSQPLSGALWETPLDLLGVQTPSSLQERIVEFTQEEEGTDYPLWGVLHNALIPQASRRHIGQFWTDEIIADWMVSWLLQYQPTRLADVGCGAGNFLYSAARRLSHSGSATELYGCDISPLACNITLASFLSRQTNSALALPKLEAKDFFEMTLPGGTDAVICNPPYTRHHHISPERKDRLFAYFKLHLGLNVPRQATLALYFLLKIIAEIPDGAHAAVIVPMEVLDARYGKAAKRILCQYTTLHAIIHFAPQMNAFHKVDVGASILLLQKGLKEPGMVRHLTLHALPSTKELLDCLSTDANNSQDIPFGSLVAQPQEALIEEPKWFSISVASDLPEETGKSGLVVPLKSLAKVVRGIATGANKFFVLSSDQVRQHEFEPYVVRTLQRNREIQSLILDEDHWQALSDEGKGVWLLYLNGQDVTNHPGLQAYLADGEKDGYHLRSLVQTRKKWYRMEQREIPPIFFTILTRGNPRFILNQAGARPLNMFSLIYPHRAVLEADATELLWAMLNSSFSKSRLHSVSRTYGGNTLKVEPRELDNLPVINPLELPLAARKELQGYIQDFYRHQQSSLFTCQVDEWIKKLLAGETPNKRPPATAIQLRLLEEAESYEAAEG